MKTHFIHQLAIITGVLLLGCALRFELPAQSVEPRSRVSFAQVTGALETSGLMHISDARIVPGTHFKTINIEGGVSGLWLQIMRHNHQDDPKGFDPSVTNLVCDFKPVATKRKDGKWEITFISDLPNPPP